MISLSDVITIPKIKKMPPDIKPLELFPHQEVLIGKATEMVRNNGFVYLTFETRVGKTPVSMFTAFEFNKNVLFITTANAMNDVLKTYAGMSMVYPIEDKCVTIASEGSLHLVKPDRNRVVIVDEAHHYGMYAIPAKRAIQLREITKGCRVILLSATPTPESYSLIFHTLWAANIDIPLTRYKNFYAWAHKHVKKKEDGTYYQVYHSGSYTNDYSRGIGELILPQIQPYMLTATKKEAGFTQTAIAEKFFQAIVPDNIKQAIATVKKERIAYLPTEQGEVIILADTAAKLLSKEHQLASGTVIPEGSKVGVILSRHKMPTVRLAMRLYSRVAIFYKFIAEKQMLIEEFGDRVTEDNQVFNQNPDKVFIGQFISKREGINLEKADAIICLNIDFAYLSYIQMINRMMSYNRTKTAVVVWIFSDNGIEEAIYKAVAKKKNYTSAYYRTRLKKEGWI